NCWWSDSRCGSRNRKEELSETQHIHHVVQAWWLPNDPLSGTQGAYREGISVTRSMRHFDAFTHSAKENLVVSDNVAGTDCLNPDFTLLPFPDKTFSGINADLIQITVHSFRQDFRNLERRPARRILFQTMMSFYHLNVVFVPQRDRHLADDLVDQIDTHAHVRGQHAGNLARKRFQLFELGSGNPRRADHHGPSILRHRA